MITSRWYPHRQAVLEFFSKLPHELDFYSKQCPDERFLSMYKGAIPGSHSGTAKINTLQKYRFCFCSEHTLGLQGYITEKIFDCFAAGCVPIYEGASNIEIYIPKECFIDTRDFKNTEDIYLFIKNMSKETHELYIKNIQKFLNSEQVKLFSKEHFNDTLYEAITHE